MPGVVSHVVWCTIAGQYELVCKQRRQIIIESREREFMQPPLDESTFSALTCDAVLVPPAQHIGEGDERITYIQQQPTWHCDFSFDGTCLAVCYGAPDPCVRIRRTEQRIARSGEICRSWTLYTTLSGIQTRTIRSVKFSVV